MINEMMQETGREWSPHRSNPGRGEDCRPMKKQIAVLAFAILLLPFIPFMNAASAQGVSYAALHSVQFIGYAPGTLVISYPHTTTVNSNISSLSGGRYTYKEVTSSPFSTMTFSLNASDIYTVYFVIHTPSLKAETSRGL